MGKPKTLREAAVAILKADGPCHYRDLTAKILDQRLAESTSKTPEASLNAIIAVDIQRNGVQSEFIRIKPGVFGLRALHTHLKASVVPVQEPLVEQDESEQRVRAPLFPIYREIRDVLRVWPGRPKRQITGFHAAFSGLRGTPQNTVDWSEPDVWLPQRLSGEDLELGLALWRESTKKLNPRYTYGHWLLCQKYELLREKGDGNLELTERGEDFLQNQGGEAEQFLDEQEGLLKLLSLVAELGPTRPGGLYNEWVEYLNRFSPFGSPSTFRDSLHRRLKNLLERELVTRKIGSYSVTEFGLNYLGKTSEEGLEADDHQEMWVLVKKQEGLVRESLQELLADLDPYAFEHLVKRLLEEMDYQNVIVTSPSGDGGIDVVADIELGITSVREVVQVKRHRRAIQRKDLDALRGSLYRFNAVRGTIITTSRFAKGTMDAAFAQGAAPITLIDGDKLIDMLIEHGIGVRKRTFEVLTLAPEGFVLQEEEG